MKPEETTPKALLKFFSELESGGTEEECELHYGCGCVIGKGLKAAQMLVEVQKALGVEAAAAAGAKGGAGSGTDEERIQLTDFEAALMAPGFPKAAAPAGPDPETRAKLEEAEGEIDRLLVQTVDLKEENKKLRAKIKDLYKQIERLYTRSEMSKLLGTLDEKIAKEAEQAAQDDGEEPEGAEEEIDADAAETPDGSTDGEEMETAESGEEETVAEEAGAPETEAAAAEADVTKESPAVEKEQA